MCYHRVFKICVLVVMLGLIFGITCRAGEDKTLPRANPELLFRLGNEYYEKAEYDRAADEYEKILTGGHESAELYYNLAGAYFKSGKLGKATLNYERAKRIMPRDADLISNYRYARTMVKGKFIPGGGVWTWRPFRIYCGNFAIDELTWVSSGLYLLVIILIFAAIIRPSIGRYHVMAIFLLVGFILLNSAIIWHKSDLAKTGGVIVVLRTEALYGPFDSATKFFTLHEGMGVSVLKSKNGWCKVRRADGKAGWIHKNDVEMIHPRTGQGMI
jgi:tetratricopeptide (TPR) repeat protein